MKAIIASTKEQIMEIKKQEKIRLGILTACFFPKKQNIFYFMYYIHGKTQEVMHTRKIQNNKQSI